MTQVATNESQDRVLAVNPGSTSTKIAIYGRGGRVVSESIEHDTGRLRAFDRVRDQLDFRLAAVQALVTKHLGEGRLRAIVGRGGLLHPLPGGVFRVNDAMEDDLLSARYGEHASNLGAPIARALGRALGRGQGPTQINNAGGEIPSFIADSVVTDEMLDEARLSGVPEIVRKSRVHALNIRASARKAAAELGRPLADCRFVVAHLGGGFSVCAMGDGRILDVNDALLGMGPFSPERAGALPIGPLVEMATSGDYDRGQLLRKLARESGLKGYLGTNDVREVLARIDAGDERAALVYTAMLYGVAKELGAMAAVLRGRVDGVILTGGVVHADRVVDELRERVGFIGRVFVYPGENELESLAAAGFRVLDGDEPVFTYEAETNSEGGEIR